jgi:hypothetical protein
MTPLVFVLIWFSLVVVIGSGHTLLERLRRGEETVPFEQSRHCTVVDKGGAA